MLPKAHGRCGPRKGSKYATLTDILAVCAKGAEHGLSHSGQARLVGETLWREVLHHGLVKASTPNTPFLSPTRARPASDSRIAPGGSITYARKYCLQGLYGLFADDGLDPDEISYGDAGTSQSKPSRSSTPKDSPSPFTRYCINPCAGARND